MNRYSLRHRRNDIYFETHDYYLVCPALVTTTETHLRYTVTQATVSTAAIPLGTDRVGVHEQSDDDSDVW